MITPRKRIANRRNAQKSSGPKTEDGKRRSAVNAMQHGLSVPLVRSRWIEHLDAVARMLMDDDSLAEAEHMHSLAVFLNMNVLLLISVNVF